MTDVMQLLRNAVARFEHLMVQLMRIAADLLSDRVRLAIDIDRETVTVGLDRLCGLIGAYRG